MKTREFKDTIEFTNDGQISLFFLGTGNAFSKKYYQNNALIIKGKDHLMMTAAQCVPFHLQSLIQTLLK